MCDETEERFPWEDVRASQADLKLQKRHAERPDLPDARCCPQCGAAPSDLHWIYFRSPPETWELLCGREGWLALCERCHRQVHFDLTAMN